MGAGRIAAGAAALALLAACAGPQARAEVVPAAQTFRVRAGQSTWSAVAGAIVEEAKCPAQPSASLTAFGQLLRRGTSSQPSSPHLDQMVSYDPAAVPCATTPTTTPPTSPTSTAAPTTTSDTSPTTTTVAPSTTPSTTAPPAPTTTQPSTTSTTVPSPSTTSPPAGVAFFEDFSTPGAWRQRMDFDWAGEVQAGALFNDAANDWHGDHDTMCGDPAATSRNIHVTPPAGEPGAPAGSRKDVSQVFYDCTPGGGAGNPHLMTSVNTEGYAAAWFSPKQVFTNVRRVCWDQTITWLGGGKWIVVNFLTPAEYQGQTDIGYTSPDFPNENGPSTPKGEARNGVKYFSGGLRSYTDGQFRGGVSLDVGSQRNPITDKATRYQMCVRDNENGTITLTMNGPSGPVTGNVAGSIPNGPVRVEWADDNYNPDKHFHDPETNVPRDSSGLYTWHWDRLTVETG